MLLLTIYTLEFVEKAERYGGSISPCPLGCHKPLPAVPNSCSPLISSLGAPQSPWDDSTVSQEWAKQAELAHLHSQAGAADLSNPWREISNLSLLWAFPSAPPGPWGWYPGNAWKSH